MQRAIQIFLGVVMFTAGSGKLFDGHAFPGLIGPVWLVEKLEPHGLALFGRFIAYSQIVIGYLLFNRRSATLGAVMLVPMLLNILVITISLEWRGTPYVVSAFLAMNAWLLWKDRERWLPLLPSPATAAGLALVCAAPPLSAVHHAAGWAASAAGAGLALFGSQSRGRIDRSNASRGN
jgi:hypothetical protein